MVAMVVVDLYLASIQEQHLFQGIHHLKTCAKTNTRNRSTTTLKS